MGGDRNDAIAPAYTHILMPDVLEKLQLAVRPLAQDGRAKGLHDLLDGHRRARELVFGRAYKTKGAHSYRLEVDVTRRHLEDGAEDGEADKVGHCAW